MKHTLILTCSALAFLGLSVPTGTQAAVDTSVFGTLPSSAVMKNAVDGSFEIARQGRGGDDSGSDDRGGRDDRGRDDSRSRDRDDDSRSKSRSKDDSRSKSRSKDDSRSKNRSGDDSGSKNRSEKKRNRDDASGSGRRPRVPGGSGCDDAGDILEHSSCSG